MLKYDPIEDMPDIKKLIDIAENEAKMRLDAKGFSNTLGSCHILWSLKKKILKEKYKIDWKTPEEMNSDVLFD